MSKVSIGVASNCLFNLHVCSKAKQATLDKKLLEVVTVVVVIVVVVVVHICWMTS